MQQLAEITMKEMTSDPLYQPTPTRSSGMTPQQPSGMPGLLQPMTSLGPGLLGGALGGLLGQAIASRSGTQMISDELAAGCMHTWSNPQEKGNYYQETCSKCGWIKIAMRAPELTSE
jgi:hypothetical protein